MKVGIFDPYLNTLGGGEKYIFSIATALKGENEVSVFWDKDIKKETEERFGIDLSGVKFEKNIFSPGVSLLDRAFKTKKYDFIFFLSDGSFPYFLSSRNYLIFQYPVKEYNGSIFNSLKLKKIKKIICYSNFVKKFLEVDFPGKVEVLYPGVKLLVPKGKRENIILSVGRFTKDKNSKKQELLVEAFKGLVAEGLDGWKLILAGGVLPEDMDFVEKLREISKNHPVEIVTSPNYRELVSLYQKSKIYWHAAGFGEDEERNPEKVEQFGISTVEAMSGGCVPVVINAGGQREIVENNKSGMLWESLEELKNLTKEVIEDESLLRKLSDGAIKRSKNFSEEVFEISLKKILSE